LLRAVLVFKFLTAARTIFRHGGKKFPAFLLRIFPGFVVKKLSFELAVPDI
jgi:hypothetical protein